MKKIMIALLMLLLGAFAYYLFRPSIVLFEIFNIPPLHLFSHNNPNGLARFCSNHVSDICWAFFINLSAVWMDEERIVPVYRNIILLLPFLNELGMLLHITRGTFDPIDLFFYLLIFITIYKSFKQKSYAKI